MPCSNRSSLQILHLENITEEEVEFANMALSDTLRDPHFSMNIASGRAIMYDEDSMQSLILQTPTEAFGQQQIIKANFANNISGVTEEVNRLVIIISVTCQSN